MNKSIYLAAFAALALTACSNDGNDIFDQSAAERLEQYKKDYAEVLTADGGLWSMEYFANGDEKGYVFVVKFDTNGSVTFSANHNWIGGVFKQETSLWTMIADNGPVLSFNSYNTLFHVFSDPANIVGDGAPVGDDGQSDVNETGFGHEGDYEFQVMEVSDDKSTVRLMGKKRMYDIYLHRLDPSTNAEDYLAKVKEIPNRFSAKFNDLIMEDVDGNKYRVYNMHTAIPSVYPLDGDAISQTVSSNGIFTLDGFRFMKPLEIRRADDSEFELDKLYFAEDGSMNGGDIVDLRCISPLENVVRQDMTWTIDPESYTGKVKELYDAANDAIVASMTKKDVLGAVDLTYGTVEGSIVPQLVTRIGSRICRDYIEYTLDTDPSTGNIVPSDQLHFSIFGRSTTSEKYDTEIPAYKAFKDYLTGNFVMSVNNLLIPDVITLSDKNDSSSSFKLKVK